MRSRITYFRSPFPNTRPRLGSNPCPRHGPRPKKPFIPLGPNMTSSPSFAPRSRRQLPPVRIPQRVPEPPLAGAHLYVPVLREPGEHPVRLGHAERGLQRGPGGRELPVTRERLEKLLLLAPIVHRPPSPSLHKKRHIPHSEHERRHQEEGDHPEEKEEGEEVEERTRQREEKQPPDHQSHHHQSRWRRTAEWPHPPSPAPVTHPAPTVHLASIPARTSFPAVYHDIS